MLVSKHSHSSQPWPYLHAKKTSQQIYIFQFPNIPGLEDISKKLNSVIAESPFSALCHVFALSPIKSSETAQLAERVLEYLERAFEKKIPVDIANYSHLLLLLIDEYDAKHYVKAAKNMPPHLFLQLLLKEEGINQKDLIPHCFRTESQISEFLHQKVGRKKIKYEQAVALGKKFKVSPLNFLETG